MANGKDHYNGIRDSIEGLKRGFEGRCWALERRWFLLNVRGGTSSYVGKNIRCGNALGGRHPKHLHSKTKTRKRRKRREKKRKRRMTRG